MVRCLTLLALAACRPGTPGGDADGDGFAAVDDCDDDDDAVFPGAPETCDGRDEDCDGEVDEAPSDAPTWYPDDDADGWGDDHRALTACDAPLGAVALAGDCDDAREAAHPGAPEACDGLDDDCDGAVDLPVPADAPAWFPDADGDGWGAPEPSVASCAAPDGHVASGTDCDDGDAAVHPEAVETCDGRDEDCDGAIDEDDDPDPLFFLDADGDGYGERAVLPCEGVPVVGDPGDCDDADADVHPGASELCENHRDDDCDGTVGPCRWGVNIFEEGDVPPLTARLDALADNHFAVGLLGGDDFDRDGAPDVLVASFLDVWFYPGPFVPSDVLLPDAAEFLHAPNGISSMWDGGDFSGDGRPDIWISKTLSTLDLYSSGSRRADAPVLSLDTGHWTYGSSPRTADISGDGLPDLLLGTPLGPLAGAVYVVNGPEVGRKALSDVADAIVRSSANDLGDEVAVLGDTTGDGLADFAVGNWEGRVYVFESPIREVVSPADASGEIRGTAAAALDGDDMNGDGYADLLAGNPYYSEPGAPDRGAVFLFTGPLTGVRSPLTADAVVLGEANAELGAPRCVSDMNGDGFRDAIITDTDVAAGTDVYGNPARWCVRVLEMPLGGTHSSLEWDAYCSATIGGGPTAAAHGDIDADGFHDLGFSAKVANAPSVYLLFGTGM